LEAKACVSSREYGLETSDIRSVLWVQGQDIKESSQRNSDMMN